MTSTSGLHNRYGQSTNATTASPLALAKQQLQARGPLDTSRSIEISSNPTGPDGTPIGIPVDLLIARKTGNPILDQANRTASKLFKFGVKSSLDVGMETVKGGLYGSTVGAIMGVAMFMAGSPKWGKPALKRLGLWVGGLYLVGGVMGSIMRGFQAFRQNMNTGLNLVRSDSFPRQR